LLACLQTAICKRLRDFSFSGKPEANGAQRRLLVSLSTRPPEIAADGSVDAIVS